MAHQTTIVTRTQHDSSAGSPFPCVFLKLKKASCPIPVHYRSATRLHTSPVTAVYSGPVKKSKTFEIVNRKDITWKLQIQ